MNAIRENILVVEDDQNISKIISYNLEKAGYNCIAVESAEEALEVLELKMVDLITLDVMLPEMNGMDLCSHLKKDEKLSRIPIIMLTAKGEEVDRVLGFELGADDYMVKPFSPRELVLRAKSILKWPKQKQVSDKEEYCIGDLRVNIPRHKVYIGKKEIKLTATEFNLLVTLLERRGRVQSRRQLLEDVWQIEADIETRTVDTHISFLRYKLGKMGYLIESVRGYGYRISSDQ